MGIYLPLLLGTIPSLAWLVFYLREDPHPEPKRLIAETFFAGAICTLVVLACQQAFNGWLYAQGLARQGLYGLFGLALIEEVFKFLAARLVISHNPQDFDEPVDGMVYLVVAGLGFACVENIAAAFQAQHLAFETASLRFIGATLLHTLSSGLIGYYWAKSIFRRNRFLLPWGILLGTALHVIFNWLIIHYEPVAAPTAFLSVFAVFILYDFEKLKNVTTPQ